MSNTKTPDLAGLFLELNEKQDLRIREMHINQDAQRQPLSAHLVFHASVSDIPKNLPTHVISGDKEIPIVYQTYQKN